MILHKILRGDGADLYLPFGLSRLRALEKTFGSGFFAQKYQVDGFEIEVRQAPPYQYVYVTATGAFANCINGTTFRQPWSLGDGEYTTLEYGGHATPEPAWVKQNNILRIVPNGAYGSIGGLWLELPEAPQANNRYVQAALVDIFPFGSNVNDVVLALYTGNPDSEGFLDATFVRMRAWPDSHLLEVSLESYSGGDGGSNGDWSGNHPSSTATLRYEISSNAHRVYLDGSLIIAATYAPFTALGTYVCLFPDTTVVNGRYGIGVKCMTTGKTL